MRKFISITALAGASILALAAPAAAQDAAPEQRHPGRRRVRARGGALRVPAQRGGEVRHRNLGGKARPELSRVQL